jgi:hypothetical protein
MLRQPVSVGNGGRWAAHSGGRLGLRDGGNGRPCAHSRADPLSAAVQAGATPLATTTMNATPPSCTARPAWGRWRRPRGQRCAARGERPGVHPGCRSGGADRRLASVGLGWARLGSACAQRRQGFVRVPSRGGLNGRADVLRLRACAEAGYGLSLWRCGRSLAVAAGREPRGGVPAQGALAAALHGAGGAREPPLSR